MLTSEVFIQNIGSISEESVAWLNDGDSLQRNRQRQDHQSVHITGNGKTISLFT